MTGYFAPMDPNDLLAMAWKWQRGDVSRNTGGDRASALGRIKAKTYVMLISHDMFFPFEDCELEQRLIPGSQFRPAGRFRQALQLTREKGENNIGACSRLAIMADITYFVALQFVAADDGVAPGETVECLRRELGNWGQSELE
jgi:hypothetical protein